MSIAFTSGKPRALIIGGSLAGLLTGHLLRAIGWKVVIFERSKQDLSGRGAGLGATPELFGVLNRLCATIPRGLRTDVRARVGLNSDGTTFCEIPMSSTVTAWDALYGLLRASLPAECYRQGQTFAALQQTSRDVTVLFLDGTEMQCDLLVGADGLRSSVRPYVTGANGPAYAGYVAWRGAVEERQIPQPWHELLLRDMTFSFPQDQLALTVPMAPTPSSSRNARRCQFSWFCRADQIGRLDTRSRISSSITIEAANVHQIREDVLRDTRTIARDVLPPQVAHLVTSCPAPLLQPIFDFEARRMVNGRVALAGDAAFVARPHVGTGVTKAALDAACLADSLYKVGDVLSGLTQYEAERREAGSGLVRRGQYLGEFLSTPSGASLRDDQKLRMMREFGAAGTISKP